MGLRNSFNPLNIEVQNLRKEVEELKNLLSLELEVDNRTLDGIG
jgi:hypothetical protein